MTNSIVEYVLEHVDFKKYYQTRFPNWDGNHNTNVTCPFHEDKKPSLSININGSGGAYCHSCGLKIGSIIHWEKESYNTEGSTDETSAERIYSEFCRRTMDSDILKGYETALKGAPKIFESLQNELQITEQTAKRFLLGWENEQRRITIPVYDSFSQLVNVRYYRLPSMRNGSQFPKLLNADGYGSPASIFPEKQLFSLCRSKHKPPIVYWMSGERDTLKAWDDGVPSFCYTTGEQVCKTEWMEEIKSLGCRIGIVQDNDEAGVVGAMRRFGMLQKSGIDSFIVELEGENIKDYSDYRREGGTAAEFLAYEPSPSSPSSNGNGKHPPAEKEAHKPFGKIVDPTKEENLGEVKVVDIGHNPAILNHPVTVKAIVSGKMERTYSIPNIFEIHGETYELPISREMLQLIRYSDEGIEKLLKIWAGTKGNIKTVSHITVTEIEIIPMIQPGIESQYVHQRCFFFGPFIECNKPYRMTVIPTSDMKTQESIGLVIDIEPVSNILDSYKFDSKSYEILSREFHPAEGESAYESLRSLAHAISTYYSGISNRDDLHIAGLLTWISPLQFEFPFEGIQRGWLNTLVLGDTETGKSKVCQKLTSLFHCGVFINAESCSYVGLVGGAVKNSSGMFLLRWGKIPLYNRQLVVMEELSGLTTQEISWMSDIRSAGIARYDKAGLTGETSAKTRLICLSNVRGVGKSLSDYNSGVQASQALLGQNEDLARFDITLCVTDDEVDAKVINKDRSANPSEIKEFSEPELNAFKELVMFAWSLKPEQIDFTLSAYRACLTATLRLSSKYHPSLPVFKAGSGRLKLARVALAIACIQFSWSQQKQQLIVTDKHVEAAAEYLDKTYSKPSFGYARYSKIQYDLQKVVNETPTQSKLEDIFKSKLKPFFSFVANAHTFTKFDIAEAMDVHHMMVERAISSMFLANLLKKADRAEWMLSTAGHKWIERKVNEV